MTLGQPGLKRKRFYPYLQKTPKTFPEGQASPPWAGLQAGAAVQLLEELLTPSSEHGESEQIYACLHQGPHEAHGQAVLARVLKQPVVFINK